MIGGRLYASHEARLTMLGLLLENVGADEAVRYGALTTLPRPLPSGSAALLHLYQIR